MDDKGTNFPEDRMVHPSVYDIKDFYESLEDEYRKATQPVKIKVCIRGGVDITLLRSRLRLGDGGASRSSCVCGHRSLKLPSQKASPAMYSIIEILVLHSACSFLRKTI